MDKVKAPETLSYRGFQEDIVAQEQAARDFMSATVLKVRDALKIEAEMKGSGIPLEYYDTATAGFKIYYRAEVHSRNYPHPTIYKHTWRFNGTLASRWHETCMVIRKDHTINTQALKHTINRKANALWNDAKRDTLRDEMARELGDYTPPEGYSAEPTSRGVTVTYIGRHKYYDSVTLNETVDPDKVHDLIAAHIEWVRSWRHLAKDL